TIALEVHDLTVRYEQKPVLWNIDFDIPAGHLAGIVGPNGAGKSTLLKTVMNLIQADTGYVKIFGKEISRVRHLISYIPQTETVDWDFPASVEDVVLMGRYAHKKWWQRYSIEDKSIAAASLRKVDMEAFAKRQISQLSGGQQQRVFIARALTQQAEIYLMDEPFAGIDAASEMAIFKLMEEMRDQGKTILVVHHDLQSAYKFFDYIVLLNQRLIDAGPKDDVFTVEKIQETYGGQLNLLSKLSQIIKKKALPIKE
ncbi:UNVERIFIED_CONTAM: hypothetical protein GTU68_048989, partial [Idotea baltica]|nr:hypothetical protein [Idotea baltica]